MLKTQTYIQLERSILLVGKGNIQLFTKRKGVILSILLSYTFIALLLVTISFTLLVLNRKLL